MGRINNLHMIDMGQGDFADTGCAIHSACLSCPLPRCISDYIDILPLAAMSHLSNNITNWYRIQGTDTIGELADVAGITKDGARKMLSRYRRVDGDFERFIGMRSDG